MNYPVSDPNQPLVSVIIPTYNRSTILSRCIQSVLDQTFNNFEIIVVDDGSTDDTQETLASCTDPRLRSLRQENSGQAMARRRGLELARGTFIALLDSDDYWEPEFLLQTTQALRLCNADLAFTNYRIVDPSGNELEPDAFSSRRPWLTDWQTLCRRQENWFILPSDSIRQLYLEHFPPGCSGALFRRRIIAELPHPEVRLGDDYLFFLDMILMHRPTVCFTREVLWNLREHGGNIRQKRRYWDRIGIYDTYCKRYLYQKYEQSLSPEEKRILRQAIANDYFDWGYGVAEEGRWHRALWCFRQSFRWARSPARLKSVVKALFFWFLSGCRREPPPPSPTTTDILG